jgi:tetratricopeptide (TPR) repeat protein
MWRQLFRRRNATPGAVSSRAVPSAARVAIEDALGRSDTRGARALIDALPPSLTGSAWMQQVSARAHQQAGEDAAALAAFDRALAADPADLVSLVLAGGIRRERREWKESARLFAAALVLAPDTPGLRYNLACVLAESGDRTAALREARLVADGAPQLAASGLLLGQLLELTDEPEEAAATYGALVAAHPQEEAAWAGLGRASRDCGRFAEAEHAFRRAGDEWALDLGLARYHRGDYEGASAVFESIVPDAPGWLESRVALANVRLSQGDFASGWTGYEARLQLTSRQWAPAVGAAWRGEPLPHGTLLVDAEQGFGDCLFAARFLAPARCRVARLVLRCPLPLHALLRTSGVADDVVEPGATVEADAHARLMSLPLLLGLTAPAAAGAYLAVDEGLAASWCERIRATDKPAVGLVWSGLVNAPQNRYRKFDPAPLAALLKGHANLFGLQLPAAGVAACPVEVNDISPALTDFAVTAAALLALDLVICADSAVAHLAGAIGVRACVLLPLWEDWRWKIAGRDNPWYDTVTPCRQTQPMQWEDVYARLRDRVASLPPRRVGSAPPPDGQALGAVPGLRVM